MSKRKSPTDTSDADPVAAFAEAVQAGEIIAGPHVRASCKRHLDDLVSGPDRGLHWDVDAALRAIGYFRDVLCLNGGQFEGLPFHLLPWQAFIVGSLHGWKSPDGFRRFRTAYIETAKGSGKSPLVAGLGLYGMTSDGEPRAEIYAAATKKDQAQILFRDAVAMVDQSPLLKERLEKSGRGEKTWNLAHQDSGSFFRTVSADDGQSGPRPHIALLDEIHEHKTRTVVDMMRAGTKSRRQAMIVMITNSGHDRTSICYEYHEYAIKVATGTLDDDSFFGFVCGLDKDDKPLTDESCWPKANPSLQFGAPSDDNGGVPGYRYLREQVTEAQGMPAKESTVRRLNFCEWVDAENPWISSAVWTGCEDDTVQESIPAGEMCYAGLDLSGTRDLTALALYFPRLRKAFVEFWTPRDSMAERTRTDRVPYDAWERSGFINAPKGQAVDYGVVAARLGELSAQYQIEAVAFDQYRMKYFTPELDAAGVAVELVQHGQGYYRASDSGLWMPRSIELMETALKEQTIAIQTNPCLRWNAASAVLESDNKENRIFAKRKSTGRIDGVVALAMAVGAASDVETSDEGDINSYLSDGYSGLL